MIDTLVWPEKYRPTSVAKMALSEGNRALLERFVSEGDIPNLLFTGPPGCGKTTVAKILTKEVDCEVLALNASNERGIDTIREKVGLFARGMFGRKRNVVFLDEADGLTNEAQDTLRNMMEAYEQTRFILTGNRLHKISAAIQSRCTAVELAEIPAGERARLLREVLAAEQIEAPLEVVFGYAREFTDMRKMLAAAQKSFLSTGTLQAPPKMPDGQGTLAAIKARQWKTLIDLSKTTGFDHAEQLRGLFWAIDPDERGGAGRLITVAKAVHESSYTRDPVILFLGCCAELVESYA